MWAIAFGAQLFEKNIVGNVIYSCLREQNCFNTIFFCQAQQSFPNWPMIYKLAPQSHNEINPNMCDCIFRQDYTETHFHTLGWTSFQRVVYTSYKSEGEPRFTFPEGFPEGEARGEGKPRLY